jgi:predicted metal-dependent peptidase
MSNLTPQQRLERAHIQLMRSKQFCLLSGIVMLGKSEVVEGLPTAATDGRDKFYGREFMESLDEKELNFVVAHENFHVLYKHLTTWECLNRQNPQLANMACDYVINQQIVDLDPTGELVKVPDIGCLLDEKYRGWDSGQVFADLSKNPPPPQGGNGEGEGQGTGSLDDHQWGEAKSMSAEEKESLSKAVDQAMRQGELLAGKMGGKSPRDIGAIPEPKVNWREQLRDFVSSVTSGRDSTTWRRPNRRWLANDVYMPSPYSESVGPMVIGIDTSASIGQQEINEFLAEVQGITNDTPPERIHLLYWDTEVAAEETYEQNDYAALAQSTKPAGGGGTDPTCVKHYVDSMSTKPEIVLMLSDGYIWGDFPEFGVPTIWGMTSDKLAPNATNIKIV